MNKGICCITEKGKMAKNELKNYGWYSSSFIQCI